MSTIMVDAAASERLSRQFESVMRRSHGRDAQLEARRFISYLCNRLERNNHALMAAPRNKRPDHRISAGYASRHGEGVMLTCLFLLNDLSARIGRRRIAEFLTATQTPAGRALARRVGSRANPDVEITGVRFCCGGSGVSSRQVLACPAPFAGTGGVAAQYRFRGHYPAALKAGFVIENAGSATSHFVAVHARLFARFQAGGPWVRTQGEAFAFLEKIIPMEAQVLAMRGFDCMDVMVGADPLNRDPVELKLMARLV